MRRAAFLAVPPCVLLLTACIPARDNENDPAKAPSVSLRVLADGLPVASTVRSASLAIEVRVSDPQKEAATVTLALVDPRTDEEAAAAGCTRFEPIPLGSVVTSSTGSVTWATFPPVPCFEGVRDQDGNQFAPFTQPVTVTAVAIDGGGNRGRAETGTVLVNARPIGDAGPTQWVDPTFIDPATATETLARLDASRSVDPDAAFDPPGSLTYQWRQISGPKALALQSLASFDVGLGPVTGTVYGLEMTVCDAWECAEPVQLDIQKRPAMWLRAHDGVALLDAGWAEAVRFHEPDSGAATSVPYPDTSEVIGARSAAWIVAQAVPYVRSLGSDLILRRTALPAGYQTENTALTSARSIVLGSAPGRDLAWIRIQLAANTNSWGIGQIERVDPLGAATVTRLPGLGTTAAQLLTVAAQRDAGSPLWIAGRGLAADYIVYQPDGSATAPSFTFALPAPCDALGGTNIEAMDVAYDGTLWMLIENAVVHVDPVARTVLGCDLLPVAGGAIPAALEWVDLDDAGSGEVLAGFESDRIFRLRDGVVDGGPNTPLLHRGIAFDPLRNRVVTATDFGMESWAPGDYGSPLSFLTVQDRISGSFNPGPFAVDYLGRPWAGATRFFGAPGRSGIIRVSPSLSLFRAHLRSEALGVTGFDDDRLASIDRASGRIWIARPVAGGGWEAAPFDERGAVPGLAPVPLPGVPLEIVHDAGLPTRPGGFWVTTTLGTGTAVVRIDFTGATVASFGDGVALPPLMTSTRPIRQALDPVTGALWGTLNLAGTVNDGVVRFSADGTFFRVNLTTVNAPFQSDPRAAVDANGDYWYAAAPATNSGTLVRTRTNQTQLAISVTAPCTNGTYFPADSVAFDASANHIVTLCKDASSEIAVVVRHSFTTGAITLIGATPTGAPPPLDFEQVGIVSPVDGTIWAPQEAGVVLLDRYGNFVAERALPVQVSVPIRH